MKKFSVVLKKSGFWITINMVLSILKDEGMPSFYSLLSDPLALLALLFGTYCSIQRAEVPFFGNYCALCDTSRRSAVAEFPLRGSWFARMAFPPNRARRYEGKEKDSWGWKEFWRSGKMKWIEKEDRLAPWDSTAVGAMNDVIN